MDHRLDLLWDYVIKTLIDLASKRFAVTDMTQSRAEEDECRTEIAKVGICRYIYTLLDRIRWILAKSSITGMLSIIIAPLFTAPRIRKKVKS